MSGYIGPQPVPQATQTREAFTATSGQTTFNTGGYTAGYIDVFLNGVKLAAADYAATNGSDVVLTTGAATGDILETVAYTAFTVADQDFTGTTTAEDLTVTGAFTSQGIDDNATSTAMTLDASGNLLVGTTSNVANVDQSSGEGIALSAGSYGGFLAATRSGSNPLELNRQSTDGDIAKFRKDGTVVGSIGSYYGNPMIGKNSGARIAFSSTGIYSSNNSGTTEDASYTLGTSSSRFTDLYLSGGVYLGGTGSANKLDDYEEGTWTPTVGQGTIYHNNARYTKVGNLVTLYTFISTFSNRTSTNGLRISGLPFTPLSSSIATGTSLSRYVNVGTGGDPIVYTAGGITYLELYAISKGGNYTAVQHAHLNSSSASFYITISYLTA